MKAQNIAVFNTEHLSPLFERVIIASGTSNRQTKALAASVRDAVRGSGFPVMRTEGEENGEWIIVDCGAAVAHIMQPEIRRYYHLEEIWGGKVVKMKLGIPSVGLVKASDGEAVEPSPAARRAGAKSAAAKPGVAKPSGVRPAAPASRKAPVKVPAKKVATSAAKAPRARSGAAGTATRKSAAGAPAAPVKAPVRKAPARKASPRGAAPGAPGEGRKAPARGAATPASGARRTQGPAAGGAKPARARAPAKKTARKA